MAGAFILVIAAAAFSVGLDDAPIERAEIYFLDAARSMVERNDWLVPYYRGEPFYDKPPLTYWLLASSFSIFGPSLASGRIVAALLAFLTLLATWWLARRLELQAGSKGAPFFSTAILATSYAFVSFARLTMSDMLLTLLTLVAGGLLLLSETGDRSRFLIPCGFLLGLGFLTKGPIAWIYFGALLAAIVIVERRWPRIFTPAGALGTLAAVLTGASWFGLVYRREGIEPLEWFFLRENLQRFAAATYDADQPFWYYFAIYAVEGLPWSILILPGALFAFRRDTPRVFRILLVWSLLMLVPLSLSKGKIDYYLLPLLPPLSLLIGGYLASGQASNRTLRILSGLTALLLLAAVFFPMLPSPYAPPPAVHTALRVFLAVAALAVLATAVRPKPIGVVTAASVSVLGAALFLFGAIVPAYRGAQPTARLLDDIARERAYAPDLQVAVCDDTLRLQRDVLFFLRTPVIEECQLWALVSSSRKYLLITTLPQERSLRSSEKVRHIASLNHLPADVTRLSTLLQGARPAKVGLLANFETADPVARRKRNQEFKRWLDTPEGQKAMAEFEARDRARTEALRRAGVK